jgi:hypothetical protein
MHHNSHGSSCAVAIPIAFARAVASDSFPIVIPTTFAATMAAMLAVTVPIVFAALDIF